MPRLRVCFGAGATKAEAPIREAKQAKAANFIMYESVEKDGICAGELCAVESHQI
jgi:hypothetical protein